MFFMFGTRFAIIFLNKKRKLTSRDPYWLSEVRSLNKFLCKKTQFCFYCIFYCYYWKNNFFTISKSIFPPIKDEKLGVKSEAVLECVWSEVMDCSYSWAYEPYRLGGATSIIEDWLIVLSSPGSSMSLSGLGDGAFTSGDGKGDVNIGISSSSFFFKFFTRLPKFL